MEEQAQMLEQLQTDVRSLAEDAARIHKAGKTLDQKATVIGRALLEQKEQIGIVGALHKQFLTGWKESEEILQERQRNVNAELETLANRLRDTSVWNEELKELSGRILELVVHQKAFAAQVNDRYEKQTDSQKQIKGAITALTDTVIGLQVPERLAQIKGQLNSIEESITAYEAHRKTVSEAMQGGQERAEEQIRLMQDDMEKQRMAVAAVVKIGAACEEKTTALCETLERLFLAKTELPETASISLEDLFLEPKPAQEITEKKPEPKRKRRFWLFGGE